MQPRAVKNILHVAGNTLYEAFSRGVLYVILFFGLGVLVFSLVLEELVIFQTGKILIDFGLATIEIFGFLTAIFVGFTLIYKDIEERTIYIILSKPVSRGQYIMGKYSGLVALLVVVIGVMTVLHCVFLRLLYSWPLMNVVKASFMIWLELSLIVALIVLFSTVTTPFLCGIFIFCAYIIGHFSGDVMAFAHLAQGKTSRALGEIFYYLVPNLQNFDLKEAAAYNLPIEWAYIWRACTYSVVYCGILLSLSITVFKRKDLT